MHAGATFRRGHLPTVMPFRIKAGPITAIAANEREAVELLRKIAGPDREQVSIMDIFGDELDPALVGRLLRASTVPAKDPVQHKRSTSR
jgi:hypothetical protein